MDQSSADADLSQPSSSSPLASRPPGPTVVGIGASAGGLEALRELVRDLPRDANLAYVVVQHLSPTHKSLLVSLLARESTLNVVEIVSGMRPEPNRIYVTPTRSNIVLEQGVLVLTPADKPSVPKPSVDEFFVSLAADQGENAVGVILSGTGSDGARGVRAIYVAGGITFAQEESTAKYNGMPHAAIETSCVNYVLSPKQIATKLADLASEVNSGDEPPRPVLEQIYDLVRQQTSVNLRNYKAATLQRRIRRRLIATDSQSIESYLELLRTSPTEARRLSQEVLISVTSFFRDPASFVELALALDALVAGKSTDAPLRIWVPGCATGEEAYSVAMLVAEARERHQRDIQVQVFATDIDGAALDRARKGIYRLADLAQVPDELRAKYFKESASHAQIAKVIRDMVVFSIHNLSGDPPFLRLDLISCRNVLIYFQQSVQQRIMWSFSYALVERGLLFLGRSESTLNYEQLFAPINDRSRLYQRLASAAFTQQLMERGERPAPPSASPAPSFADARHGAGMSDRVLQALGADLLRAALVVDEDMQLRYIYGDLSRFVRLQPGVARLDLSSLIAPALRVDIRSAMIRARREPQRAVVYQVEGEGSSEPVRLVVSLMPGRSGDPELYLIRFESFPTGTITARTDAGGPNAESAGRLAELEHQLTLHREHLQTVIEELETSNEELQSLNEELQSSNEELQSTNEELETTNEELQSTNEELTTVNDELKAKTLELVTLNNDLQNVRDGLAYPLIVVDELQRVMFFNPAARHVFKIDELTIGEPLYAIQTLIDWPDLRRDVAGVIDTGQLLECQFVGTRCYAMTLRPYVDHLGRRRGAVLSFVDDTDIMNAELQLIAANERLTRAEGFIRATFDASPSGTCIVDGNGVIVEINRAWRQFFVANDGTAESCGVGASYLGVCRRAALVGDEDAVHFQQGLMAVLAGESERFDMEYPCHSPAERRWFHAVITPFHNNGARMCMVVHTDITARKEVELQLRLQSRALDASVNGIFIADARQLDLPLIYVNAAFEQITGFAPADVIGISSRFLYGMDGQQLELRRAAPDLKLLQTSRSMQRSVRKDGGVYWSELMVYPIDDERGDVGYLVGVLRDMTEVVNSQEALKASLEHERLAYAFAGIGTFEWDIRRGTVMYSDACLKLLGFSSDRRSGPYTQLRERLHLDDRAEFDDAMRLCLAGHRTLDLECRVIWDNGQVIWLHIRGDVMLDGAGLPKELHGLTQDITDRKETEGRVRYTALHDTLTGLPNRTLLRDRLQSALTVARRSRKRVAVLFLDLDHFKAINDSLGHHVGDKVLQAVASRLITCVGDSDTLARLGGDEYVIVLPEIDEGYDARAVAIKAVEALAAPLTIGDQEIQVTPSIGISIFPEDGDGIDDLMRNADSAMYRVKTTGRRNFQFFMPELDQRAMDQFRIVTELRRALEQHELRVHYQPQVEVTTGRIVGLEALVRWQHPARGLIMPDLFIPIAETADMVQDIDLFVLKEACEQTRRWIEEGLLDCPVAVNFSPLRFRHVNVIELISTALRESRLPAQFLELELTEQAMGGEDAARTLRNVRDIGVRIALDDFGTGYSSLSYLTRFPIDKIKIDRTFVASMNDESGSAVVRAVIGLGRSLRLDVVAEGVETRDQLDLLRLEQCGAYQGYLASPAVAAEELTVFLRRHRLQSELTDSSR